MKNLIKIPIGDFGIIGIIAVIIGILFFAPEKSWFIPLLTITLLVVEWE